ncbi:MAG: hypothetical protein KF819_04140 [Labilithrix sp.]|nr:hypothetical protein [Labilithrix sp.]
MRALLVFVSAIALGGCDLFVDPSGPTPEDFARARAAYDQAEPASPDPAAIEPGEIGDEVLRGALVDRVDDARLPLAPLAQR